MSSNAEYWIKRFEELEKAQLLNDAKYITELQEIYEHTLSEIKKEINNWLVRFSVNNQISMQEAKKWLNIQELRELKWDVTEYIKYGQENGIDLIWRKELENASAKVHISRLEALEIQIQQQIEELYNTEEKTMNDYIIQSYMDNYYKTAYELQKGSNVAFKFATLNVDIIQKIVSRPWTSDEQTFSDRIWRNKKALLDTLQKDLEKALRGDADKLIEKISKDFGTSKSNAGRLVMTESAFFASASRKQCFNELWIEQYINIATLDSKTSEECIEIDGKIYDMKDYKIGVTAPPYHIRCRTTTAPYFKDEYEFGERAARNTGGKTYYIPSNITYKEWLDRFVYSDPKTKKEYETDRKMNKNKSSDFIQYNNYKKVFKNGEIPNTFEEFQKIKYNDNKEYGFLKNYYRLFNSKSIPVDLTYKTYKNNLNNNNWTAVGFNPNKLQKHYDKHKSEFEFNNANEYEKFAKEFMNKEIKGDIEGFVNENGYVFKYDNKNGIFGTSKPTGVTETLFKPTKAKEYWKEQVEKYGPKKEM